MNRRRMLQGAAAMLAEVATSRSRARASECGSRNDDVLYGRDTLPAGIRSRHIDTRTGTTLHILEAGAGGGRSCVLLLHGFPELAYTWRHQLLALANAGFHVVAPDLRGYGRSVFRVPGYDDDLLPYSMMNRVADVLGLVRGLGYETVASVVGHDWGGPTAQWCARIRPDVFRSVVSVSTPFLSSPRLPSGTVEQTSTGTEPDMDAALAALPRPRKHYFTYSASDRANDDMWHAPQGVHDLLRAMYYFKSGDWQGNRPFPLAAWAASELAKMPSYYIMDLEDGIAETMAAMMPSAEYIAGCDWMTEDDLRVYSTEFARTGFQGGLNYYRVGNDPRFAAELKAFAGRTIDVPACYITGQRDWATYQSPGAFEGMRNACSRLMCVHLIPGAGHSIGEERPAPFNEALLQFLRQTT